MRSDRLVLAFAKLCCRAPVSQLNKSPERSGLAQRHRPPSTGSSSRRRPRNSVMLSRKSAKDSKPYWPPTVVPPKSAPNVLLIMTDDQGYGVSGTFGGVIPTPAMDRIAKAGLRYTQFHSTALCSPTRAALITGRNHHSVGYGVIGEMSTGYPGYDSVIGPESATIGTILRDNGYATSWFGKNHNTPDVSVQRGRALSTSGRSAWVSSTSTDSWAARPTSGRRTCTRTRRRSSRGSASPATTSPPTWRTRPSST